MLSSRRSLLSFLFSRKFTYEKNNAVDNAGAHLQTRRHKRVLALIVRVRRILITSETIGAKIRYRLLEIIELSQNRWDHDNLSADVVYMYEDYRETYGDHYLSIVEAVGMNPMGGPMSDFSPKGSLTCANIPPPPLKSRSRSRLASNLELAKQK